MLLWKIGSGSERPIQMNSRIRQMSPVSSTSISATKSQTPNLNQNLKGKCGSSRITSLFKSLCQVTCRQLAKLKFNCRRILCRKTRVIRRIVRMIRMLMMRSRKCLRIGSRSWSIWGLTEVIMKRTKRTMTT